MLIECDIESYSGAITTSIPASEVVAAYQDGVIEAHTGIQSAAVERPQDIGGLICLSLRLARGGLVGLILPPKAAEVISLAMIRATAMPVEGWAEPGEN